MLSSSYSRGARKRSGTLADLRHAANVTAAYNTIASSYNQRAREDRWMRELLWRHYRSLFKSGDRVLDVGCGTGLDVIHLACRGVRVTGIDLSPGMIDELEAASRREKVADKIQARVADAADLCSWPGRYFHGIVSSFGSVNTVRDLSGFAADAARLLLPRGRMVMHLLAPGDVWERREIERQQGPSSAFEHDRRRHRLRVIAGQPVAHRIITSSEAYHRYFERYFALRRRYGLGFFIPQAQMGRLPSGVTKLLGRIEAVLGSFRPFLSKSRFFVLDLESRVRTL